VVVVASWRRTTARVAVLPPAVRLPELRAVVPSPRSVAFGLALLAVAVAAYLGARTTSVFAVRQIEIAGGSPLAREQAADALRPVVGTSLLDVASTVLERRLAEAPQVASVSFDRAFPHTLRVFVVPEHPVLLLRRGKAGWVVSARGRVMRRVTNTRMSSLPRMWIPRRTSVVVGSTLDARSGGLVATIFGPLAAARVPAHVQFVRAGANELTLVLRSRMEVRLGNGDDLRLKLAITRRILLTVGAQPGGYVDVSVPERPVVRPADSQVGG
jgi:cell division septal protein FtsQ